METDNLTSRKTVQTSEVVREQNKMQNDKKKSFFLSNSHCYILEHSSGDRFRMSVRGVRVSVEPDDDRMVGQRESSRFKTWTQGLHSGNGHVAHLFLDPVPYC